MPVGLGRQGCTGRRVHSGPAGLGGRVLVVLPKAGEIPPGSIPSISPFAHMLQASLEGPFTAAAAVPADSGRLCGRGGLGAAGFSMWHEITEVDPILGTSDDPGKLREYGTQ